MVRMKNDNNLLNQPQTKQLYIFCVNIMVIIIMKAFEM